MADPVSYTHLDVYKRQAQNWPFNLFDYWQRTRQVDPDDYVLL